MELERLLSRRIARLGDSDGDRNADVGELKTGRCSFTRPLDEQEIALRRNVKDEQENALNEKKM